MLRLMIESWFTYDHSLLWHYIVSICQAIEHILDIDMRVVFWHLRISGGKKSTIIIG